MSKITRPRHRIAIVVNKRREVEGFLNGLEESKFLSHMTEKKKMAPEKPWFRMADMRLNASLDKFDFTVLCIEDIMPPANSRIPETSGSHSQYKAMLLPGYLRDYNADLVVSVSTAESSPALQGSLSSLNGSVVLGGGFWTLDGHDFDPTSPSRLQAPPFQDNNVPEGIYQLLSSPAVQQEAVGKFTSPPSCPAKPMQILCKPEYIAIAAVNIVHYQAYEKADPAAYEACQKIYGDQAATIETTHGIVRMAAEGAPTLFVSPITDRYKHFAEDVGPDGKQNAAASYNAGVTVAMLLRELDKQKTIPLPIRQG